MTTTRSTVLFSVPGVSDGLTTIYTVPAGYVAVVKAVVGINNGNNASFYIIGQSPAGTTNSFTLRRLSPWSTNSVDFWTTWFVMEPGDEMTVYVDVGGTWVIASGALLVA